MATEEQQPITDTDEPATSRAGLVIVAGLLTLCLVVLVGIPVLRHVMSGRAADDVAVVPGARGLVCDGREVPLRSYGDTAFDYPRLGYRVEVTAGMRCRIVVAVVNRGGHPVHVDDVLLTLYGDESASPMTARTWNGQPVEQSPDGLDAVAPYDTTIEPDQAAAYQIELRVNPGACFSPDASTTDSPSARLGVFWWSTPVEADFFLEWVGSEATQGGC